MVTWAGNSSKYPRSLLISGGIFLKENRQKIKLYGTKLVTRKKNCKNNYEGDADLGG
jgi:hypothetical protein